MHHQRRFLVFVLGAIAVLFWFGEPWAFESYHDPANSDDTGYCATCHPGFGGGKSDTLHALHTGNPDAITGDCGHCHTGSGRDNPLTMWSDSGDNLGCAGCHGTDQGETVRANYQGLPTIGQSKASGFGLRRHHLESGETLCLSCHDSDPESLPESVLPPYYADSSSNMTDPCSGEDTGNDTDSLGLDNDGDGLYEAADPDCQRGSPARIVNLHYLLGDIQTVHWAASPDAENYQVLRGSLADLSLQNGDYGNGTCVDTGTLASSFLDTSAMNPGEGFYYLVRGVAAGTYGTYECDGAGGMVSRDLSATACD